jgi:hypothetical protein
MVAVRTPAVWSALCLLTVLGGCEGDVPAARTGAPARDQQKPVQDGVPDVQRRARERKQQLSPRMHEFTQLTVAARTRG